MSYTRVDQLLMYDLHYGIYTEPWNWGVSFRLNMPTFSKIVDAQRGSQQMVDSDGFIYSRKKPRDTPLYSAWRCRKNNPPTKCPSHEESLSRVVQRSRAAASGSAQHTEATTSDDFLLPLPAPLPDVTSLLSCTTGRRGGMSES